MVLPILDYADIVWGDKSNDTLMKTIQLLQSSAAKLILDKPKHSSATEALVELGWNTMISRRRFHRLIVMYKCFNGHLDWNFNFSFFKNIHVHDTRNKQDIRKPTSRCSWGQHRFSYHAANEWNNLPTDIRNCANLLSVIGVS